MQAIAHQDGPASPSSLHSRTSSINSDYLPTKSALVAAVPSVSLPPAYVAASAAAETATRHQLLRLQDQHDDGEEIDHVEDAFFSDPALAAINAFLDQLLFSFIATARSTGLNALRQAIEQVLKGKLAKEAMASAQEELEALLGHADDEDDLLQPPPSSDTELPTKQEQEDVWKRTRLRIMVYMRLGELEDEDEERYVDEEQQRGKTGVERRFSQSSGLVSWTGAIFMTSILEFIAEQSIFVAAQAAYDRNTIKKSGNSDHQDDRVIVEEFDLERVALNSSLGRLWRTWRRSLRVVRPIGLTSPSASRRPSAKTARNGHGRLLQFGEVLNNVSNGGNRTFTDGRTSRRDTYINGDFSEVVDQRTMSRPRSFESFSKENLALDIDSQYNERPFAKRRRSRSLPGFGPSMTPDVFESVSEHANGKDSPDSLHTEDPQVQSSESHERSEVADTVLLAKQPDPTAIEASTSSNLETVVESHKEDTHEPSNNTFLSDSVSTTTTIEEGYDDVDEYQVRHSSASEPTENLEDNSGSYDTSREHDVEAIEAAAALNSLSPASLSRNVNNTINVPGEFPGLPTDPDENTPEPSDPPESSSTNNAPLVEEDLATPTQANSDPIPATLSTKYDPTYHDHLHARPIEQSRFSASSSRYSGLPDTTYTYADQSAAKSNEAPSELRQDGIVNETSNHPQTRDVEPLHSHPNSYVTQEPVYTNHTYNNQQNMSSTNTSPGTGYVQQPIPERRQFTVAHARTLPPPASSASSYMQTTSPDGTIRNDGSIHSSEARTLSRRPSVSNVRAATNGLVAREPRIQTESTRDFADFIRSTAPDVPPGNTIPRAFAKQSAHSVGLSSPPSVTGSRRASSERLPQAPYSPPSNRGKSPKAIFQPRDARVEGRETNDLVDFLKQGPPSDAMAKGNSIPLYGVHANTRMQDSSALGTSSNNRSSLATTQSGQGSMNSHSALLSNPAGRQDAFSSPKNASRPQATELAAPVRKQRRIKDPYAISDDEDDDIITDLPKKESLADFLRNYEPPSAASRSNGQPGNQNGFAPHAGSSTSTASQGQPTLFTNPGPAKYLGDNNYDVTSRFDPSAPAPIVSGGRSPKGRPIGQPESKGNGVKFWKKRKEQTV